MGKPNLLTQTNEGVFLIGQSGIVAGCNKPSSTSTTSKHTAVLLIHSSTLLQCYVQRPSSLCWNNNFSTHASALFAGNSPSAGINRQLQQGLTFR